MNILKSRRKAFLLLTMLLTCGMASAQVVIKGTVYGGGEGLLSDEKSGLVTGNTTVIMNGGIIERSLYGGGEVGSVGTFTEFYTEATGGHVVGEPKTCAAGTGKAEVLIRGGQVGRNETIMPEPGATTYEDDLGYVFCGGRGEADTITYPLANLFAVVKETHLKISGNALVMASVYGGCENGLVMGNTYVEIVGGQIGTGYNKTTHEHDGLYTEQQWTTVIEKIKNGTFTDADASAFHECDHWPYGDGNGNYYTYDVYADSVGYEAHGGALYATDGHTFYGNVFGGGSGYYPFWDEENDTAVWRRSAGRVWGNTVVDISGGHILTNIYGGNEQTDVMCKSTVNMRGGTLGVPRTLQEIQNHPVTCYLFGAGKGDQRSPFRTWTNVQNAEVNVSGDAFVFGSVFGGGEDGHVLGDVTLNIGQGVHIGTYGYSYVDGNVFGGGRGFSGENIEAGSVGGNAEVNISGGTMLGSVYGGGRLASMGIGFSGVLDPEIGYFQPDANGVTHGHVTINITGGTIGNDYESKLHLGNPILEKGRSYGGNVFGGSMGRLTKLNGDNNPLWPILGQVKTTEVNISNNAIIKGSVFGGGEFGLVLDTTNVNISGGTIWRNVYGGGQGSNDNTTITDVETAQAGVTFRYTPMAFSGVVSKTANVKISGGWVKKNVYGGGEKGSVGLIDFRINDNHEFVNITKHEDETNSFALSWPYKYEYFEGFTGNTHVEVTGGRIGITGKDFMGPWVSYNNQMVPYVKVDDNVWVAIVIVGDQYNAYQNNNGTWVAYTANGFDAKDALKAAREDNGDVYGGGHGIAGDRYDMAFCSNADSTSVIVNYTSTDAIPTNYAPSDWEFAFYPTAADWVTNGVTYGTRGCIAGSVYGGGDNGHVLNLAEVTLTKGLIGHAIYGGGKGKETYTVRLLNLGSTTEHHDAEIYSLTAGKVFGNTAVTVNAANNTDAYVMRNIYGGGNMASVGKGNYAGGSDDYSIAGYGEKVANLWTGAEHSDAWHFLNSGKTTVNVTGGTVGTASGTKDDLPTGNVYGGCRGEAAPNIPNSPRYQYAPSFFSGYVNKTDVTIGRLAEGTQGEQGYVPASGPVIYGSVYGGGQDGHVRRSTNVTVNYGEIGLAYTAANITNVGTNDLNNTKWQNRGIVFGGGSGLSKYEYDLPPYNGTIEENHEFTYTYNGRTITLKEKDYSNSSGSVTDSTSVVVNGGTIYHNVYGGGSLATVGPPFIPGTIHSGELGQPSHWSTNIVTVANGTIGESTGVIAGYGGHVFGAGRGDASLDIEKFTTSVQTKATIGSTTTDNALVYGNVYGGGEIGQVSDDTEANMVSGQVGTIGYVYKTTTDPQATPTPALDSVVHITGGKVFGGGMGITDNVDAARVKGNSNVNISGGHVFYNVYGGGELASVGESEEYTYTYTDANNQTSTVQDFKPKAGGYAMVTITGGQLGPAPGTGTYLGHPYDVYIGLNGVDGYAFGGGEGIGNDPDELYKSFANVNYASVKVDMPMDDGTHTNRLWGSIFGGAEDGHVLGSDTVRLVSGLIGTYGTTSYDGNIFGGGRNYSKKNYTAGRTRGNITVEMSGGQLYGSIFGGGRLALTGVDLYGNILTDEEGENGAKYGNVFVKVNGGTIGNDTPVQVTYPGGTTVTMPFIQNFTKHPMGDVFGGGKGSMEGIANHPKASALLVSLVKNTEIIVTDSVKEGILVGHPKILGSVFGGGEVGTVGQFEWANVLDPLYDPDDPDPDHPTQYTIGDITLKEGTGKTKVTVSGGQIGYDRMLMDYTLVGGNGADKYNLRFNTDVGHVFGGGEGEYGNPANYPIINPSSTTPGVHNNKRLIDLMGTVGETQVIISDTLFQSGNVTRSAWVKGSVYGGAMNGHVLNDTKVTIKGGQIGAGHYNDKDSLYYGPNQFFNPNEYFTEHSTLHDVDPHDALAECVCWPYGHTENNITHYDTFDPILISNGHTPSDGKTWFGNVFGGGSGYYPYIVRNHNNTADSTVWNRESGKVYGNSTVIVTGGHILTNIYGGCETTDVGHFDYTNGIEYKSGGLATIKMSGGTLGVPRTLAQIDLHPVTCYIFGAGKGDPRTNFNTWTNVQTATVEVSGGYVYGSIFGGGEEGHVMNDVTVTVQNAYDDENNLISSPVIGTTGVSYVDGNIFGGGRGFSGEALTAGIVGGNINVHIKGGTMLGSIYGGGRLASVGTHFTDPNNANYGQFQEDETGANGKTHGHIVVDISGGTIGNPHEYDYTAHPLTNKLTSTIGGNVFAGAMGRLTKLNGTINPLWPSLAKVKSTNLTIRGANTVVKSSVYGGGQFGTVRDDATVNIQGGTIGTEVKDPAYNGTTNKNHYHYGSVYGAGFGSNDIRFEGDYANDSTANGLYKRPVEIAGRVYGNTFVNISGGQVLENVFGGGELASIGMVKTNSTNGTTTKINGVARVTMTGGEVGPLDMTGLNGYVYGGSEGLLVDLSSDHKGLYKNYFNVNETHVTVEETFNDEGELVSSPHVYGSLFGGGSDGHVLGDANVTFNGGTLGTWSTTTWDGNIFGGGRNFKASNLTAGRVEGNIHVNMGGGFMYGNIYGGGRLACTGVDVVGDTIAGTDHGYIFVTVTGGTIGEDHKTTNGHDANDQPVTAWVGQYGGNVFGGAMGYDLKPDMAIPTTIPTSETDPSFGAYTDSIRSNLAWVKNTEVNVGGVADTAFVWGNVFGGGRSGRVYKDTKVTIEGATVVGVDRVAPLAELFYSGSVYGGGLGSETSVTTNGQHLWPEVGRVFGNDSVFIKNKSEKVPLIRNNIFGGGALASMGTLDANGTYTTDPNGKPTGNIYVEMSGGELGPLDMSGINAYVFAGGQGQPQYIFKDFGKVNNTHLVVKDEARVFGSIFGGGEDGQVVGNALIDMDGGYLGTTGQTTWDGNIFGGGRNFSAQHKIAGRVGGNVTVNVRKGTLLGSVFGGGRLGSVGVNDLDGNAFAMQGGDDHGFITVNIGGDDADSQFGDIVIGHDVSDDHDKVGGNVYGGGKGIAGPSTSIYPDLAQVKQTTVNIKEREGNFKTWIKGSVFGSGEDGHVLQDTYVNVYDGQIGGDSYSSSPTLCEDIYHGNVYGGGRGLDTYINTTTNQPVHSETAGIVYGNTNVNIYGGRVVRSVFGGGNLSSVGTQENGNNVAGTGLATVNVVGGTIGVSGNNTPEHGHVFGGSHGGVGGEYTNLAFVTNTHVTIDSVAQVYGSVFGGGEDGHVRGNTLVDVCGGSVGSEGDTYELHGNVYGGGRGLETGSPTAGEVYGYTTVNIKRSDKQDDSNNYYTPNIYDNVFGGGSRSVVQLYKEVNMSDGHVYGSVFGGSRDIPSERSNIAPRWVNIWGGTVEKNVYGCSHSGADGDLTNENNPEYAAFINMSGGTVKGNVFGADYHGRVEGSVGILIGKKAIETVYTTQNTHKPATITKAKLDIQGSVYAGSDYTDATGNNLPTWGQSTVTGTSDIYIDGEGYNTTSTEPTDDYYMNIGGGVFGSGTHCEASLTSHNILLREYGTRTPSGNGEMTSATRTLTTIQRAGNVIIDHANVNLSGLTDISNSTNTKNYGVMRVSDTLVVINASSIVLGSATSGAYALMDSIYSVQSLNLAGTNPSIYNHNLNELKKHSWYWVGIKDGNNDAKLYNIDGTGSSAHVVGNALNFAQENVILYNDTSKLRVRYHEKTTGEQYYGELRGFFRMRANHYTPHGTESFAYARPKVLEGNDVVNKVDGGFLSYYTAYNDYVAPGAEAYPNYSNTIQYPYINEMDITWKGDMQQYRMWVIPYTTGRPWYVDGRNTDDGGIGLNGLVSDETHDYRGRGLYPDLPKLTISADGSSTATQDKKGIYAGAYPLSGSSLISFDQEKDAIYVVGPVSSTKELAVQASGLLNQDVTKTLRLYRYPGGHLKSNGALDEGTNQTVGPNYDAMLVVEANKNLTLDNVLVDGLYGYDDYDGFNQPIPAAFDEKGSFMPLVITNSGSTLDMKGTHTENTSGETVTDGTILTRGYNNIDAGEWLTNADYESYLSDGAIPNGGALFVDENAIVNVEGLVTINDNLQQHMVGRADIPVSCNVYLPTFGKAMRITNTLAANTAIGVTSPKRNAEPNYEQNTFSSIAVGVRDGQTGTESNAAVDARTAWVNCNFTDDQGWFFVNQNKTTDPESLRTTYYGGATGLDKSLENTKLYFGWTWANVVRKEPAEYDLNGDVTNDFDPEAIDSPHDLAWLISQSMGMNGQTGTDFTGVSMKQSADLDMQQYVWVPIGDADHPFAGGFDGQGHLIKNLYIKYIGTDDGQYKRDNYGMFGNVSGTVDRTFVMSGRIEPEITDLNGKTGKNLGGLVGYLVGSNAVVSNSEAALMIVGPSRQNDLVTGNAIGGLVGCIASGEIHSSMAMSNLCAGQYYNGVLGGLVGKATGGQINNSFANATFTINAAVKAGGLVGENAAAMENCYAAWKDASTTLSGTNFGSIAVSNTGTVAKCYVQQDATYNYVATTGNVTGTCKPYSPVMDADKLGYMYSDNNIIRGLDVNNHEVYDTTMFVRLNEWIDDKNAGTKYARWTRPGLAYYEGTPLTFNTPINGDLPVLLISNYNADGKIGSGGFRSLGTYAGGPALQYGGPDRDGTGIDLTAALTREKASTDNDYLFIYGDVSEAVTAAVPTADITQTKVSVHEDASITNALILANCDEVYVGVTFDNSYGKAVSTFGVNYGMQGSNLTALPRDWHMFSTPLSSVPLGFEYEVMVKGESNPVNTNEPSDVYQNNPWSGLANDFNWLVGPGSDECGQGADYRYWMKEYSSADGYFPTSRGILFTGRENELFIVGSDECPEDGKYRYPYGMDFYAWYEPEYHWINFKRNGPNHWHSDEPHDHLEYWGSASNVNEETLITGKGYMGSITLPTLMQSHGRLNQGPKTIALNKTDGSKMEGWNLVGNPYHGYIDFSKLVDETDGSGAHNSGILAKKGGTVPFYVVYDADTYQPGNPGTGFLYRPREGSSGGAYAGPYIHPHQGFYVQTTANGSDLQFTENMLVTRKDVVEGEFRKDEPTYPLVNLYLSSDHGCRDVTVIEFERPEWGGAEKIKELRVGNGLFYAHHGDYFYAAMFAPSGIERVPLWFEAKEDDVFTMRWNTANGDFQSMYLIDNITGVQYDMLRNDTYTFEGHKSDYRSRFYIVFDVNDVEEHELNSFVFFDGSEYVVTGEGELEFVDMLGHVLLHTHVDGGQTRVRIPKVSPAMYLMRLTNGQECQVQKIVVKE